MIVKLSGELDLSVRSEIDRTLARLVAAPIAILDLRDVTFADTTLLNGVVRVARERKARLGQDAPVRIFGATRMVACMFYLTFLDEFVRFYSSASDAWAGGPSAIAGCVEAGGLRIPFLGTGMP